MAAIGGSIVLVVGVVLLISPAPSELAITMLVMAIMAALRVVIMVFQTVLYMQNRDYLRLAWAIGLVPVKFGLLVLLSPLGAVGAAITSVVADAMLLTAYTTTLYWRRKPLPAAADQEAALSQDGAT